MAKATKKSASKTITMINPEACRFIRSEAVRVLSEHFAQFGVNVKGGNAKYQSAFTDMKFTFSCESAGNLDENNYRENAVFHGMKPEWFGKLFTLNGKQFKICGLKISGRAKNSVKIQSNTGKVFVTTPTAVILAFGNKTKK